MQSWARGDGLCFKGALGGGAVAERAGPGAPGRDGELAPCSPQGLGTGLMSLSVDVGPRRRGLLAALPAWARPARCLPCTWGPLDRE